MNRSSESVATCDNCGDEIICGQEKLTVPSDSGSVTMCVDCVKEIFERVFAPAH